MSDAAGKSTIHSKWRCQRRFKLRGPARLHIALGPHGPVFTVYDADVPSIIPRARGLNVICGTRDRKQLRLIYEAIGRVLDA
ncbi:MAG: hypothetical protein KGL39_53330 [Patescibacteria group bacterium]|nr:hypothetical protein [Patescibacteria group bacterium]